MSDSKSDGGRSEHSTKALRELESIATRMQEGFERGRRVLSFQQYLDLFCTAPDRYGRDASRYVRDMFDHYGTRVVGRPWGPQKRFQLFDRPWVTQQDGAINGREPALVGHEELQNELYRSLSNFAQEGRANRLILMHGPNGSAKSTAASCVLRALEHYSARDDGALYRFHWVFPSRKTVRGSIGFSGDKKGSLADDASYAHLEDEQIDARLVMEVRDHPLFLIPLAERQTLLRNLHRDANIDEPPSEWLMSGRLAHKNQQVFEALLSASGGSLAEVLRHVQVERYFISRRYRVGAVTVGPQLSVDAGERQITADRSLSALPTALQATTMFEAHGELVDAAGGVLEFSDLLKRPLEAFRYLQLTLETGEVALSQQNLQTNCVMIGSANEIHLGAFREHPEYPSFRGRFELVRVGYLRSYIDEEQIYQRQIIPYLDVHVAPHAAQLAAKFAVLTRMIAPEPEHYPDDLAKLVATLTAMEKMELYATGEPPERMGGDDRKVLRANVSTIYEEHDGSVEYEGRFGASPRSMRTLLLDAAQHPDYRYLSPFGVLSELDELCRRTSEYDWLKMSASENAYQDYSRFRTYLRDDLLEALEEDMRIASGLVDETRYQELFDKYVAHVSAWVKGEKIRNNHTGEFQDADERMMREVEAYLGVSEDLEDHRKGLISGIAAWAIDHPGGKMDYAVIFPDRIRKLRDAVFLERRKPVAELTKHLVTLLRARRDEAAAERAGTDKSGSPIDLHEEERRNASEMFKRLEQIGYNEDSALDAAAALLKTRLSQV